MKTVRIASISLAGLLILTPCAYAKQATTTVSYVPKLQPVKFPHQEASADVLGIRIGMTVAQAEAVAEKSMQVKPSDIIKRRDKFRYRGLTVQSHPYVQSVSYSKSTAHGGEDSLSLTFLGPATGNRLFSVYRTINFNGITPYTNPKKALTDPLIKTLKASLIKKYGPPSYRGPAYNGFIWAFTQKSRLSWSKSWPTNEWYTQGAVQRDHNLTYYVTGNESPYQGCGAVAKHSNVFLINAAITVNAHDKTKADGLKISIWDPPACLNDASESIKQMKADAIKAYKSVSAPAAPKL